MLAAGICRLAPFVVDHMKRFAIVAFSFIGGWALATALVLALNIAGLNVAAALARTYSEYSSYSGAEVLVFLIVFSWFLYRTLTRRFLGGQTVATDVSRGENV